jgi:hypothetical protein
MVAPRRRTAEQIAEKRSIGTHTMRSSATPCGAASPAMPKQPDVFRFLKAGHGLAFAIAQAEGG